MCLCVSAFLLWGAADGGCRCLLIDNRNAIAAGEAREEEFYF